MGLQNFYCYILLVATVTQFQQSSAIKCYTCDNDPISTIYVPDCGDKHYHNDTHIEESDNEDYCCEIVMWYDGYLTRGLYEGDVIQNDGDCLEGAVLKKCFCKGDLCNTNSFCEECGDPVTATSPTPTSDTPTSASITTETSTPTTIASPDPPATEPTPAPGGTLECYSCEDCPTIDDALSIESEDYRMCQTTLILETKQVNRGGALHEHVDGECLEDEFSEVCWCAASLCNNKSYAPTIKP